ncbi:uncharacterized protein LOC135688070 [Rhopilema esculentum]|uniref:uncharacterized protein LOC135688070 n=1 Tax=Rhopilema esculentum TaxID=499914 RepID=UPI0031DCB85E
MSHKMAFFNSSTECCTSQIWLQCCKRRRIKRYLHEMKYSVFIIIALVASIVHGKPRFHFADHLNEEVEGMDQKLDMPQQFKITDNVCKDNDKWCPYLASLGRCNVSNWMQLNCRKSCNECT